MKKTKDEKISILLQTVYLMGALSNTKIPFEFKDVYFAITAASGRESEWLKLCEEFNEKYIKEISETHFGKTKKEGDKI